MKRQQSIALRVGALALLVFATASYSSPRVRAQERSSDAQNVWVVDDVTQATTCLRAPGVPCSIGQIDVGFVHRIPLATAAAAHRHYSPADPGAQGFDSFVHGELLLFHNAHAASSQNGGLLLFHNAHAASSQQIVASPSTCTNDHEVHNHWQVTSSAIGATFDEDMYHHIYASCIDNADYHTQTYDSGHGIWKAGTAYVYDGGGNQLVQDDDGAQTCNGMDPHSVGFGFNGSPNLAGKSGLHTYVRVSSGSACTFFDTYDAINFWWY